MSIYQFEPETIYPDRNICKYVKGISSVANENGFDWVVEDCFAKDYVSIIFGESGCGKTWVTLDLALSLSNGAKVFDKFKVDKTKVLYVEGDAPSSIIKERLEKLNIISDDEYFQYINKYEVERDGYSLSLSENIGRNNFSRIVENCKPKLIIIDTLISFIDDEKDAEQVKIIVDFIKTIATKNHCHIALVHHSRKRESGQIRGKLDQSDVIGSSIFTRLAGFVLGVDRCNDDESSAILSIKKSWYKQFKPIKFTIKDNEDATVMIDYGEYNEIKSKAEYAQQEIVNYIRDNHIQEFARKELFDEFLEELSQSSIKNALKNMVKYNMVEETGSTKDKIFKVVHTFF